MAPSVRHGNNNESDDQSDAWESQVDEDDMRVALTEDEVKAVKGFVQNKL